MPTLSCLQWRALALQSFCINSFPLLCCGYLCLSFGCVFLHFFSQYNYLKKEFVPCRVRVRVFLLDLISWFFCVRIIQILSNQTPPCKVNAAIFLRQAITGLCYSPWSLAVEWKIPSPFCCTEPIFSRSWTHCTVIIFHSSEHLMACPAQD